MFDLLRASSRSLPASFALMLVLSASAHAGSIYVATHGTDSGSCGPKTDPCRSITQGITNAAVGGSIVVGPGQYGDVDQDGTPGEAGEEPLAACSLGSCLLRIDKQVTITSSDGAFATVIDGGPSVVAMAVGIDVEGAVFGDRNKGFTIKAPAAPGAGIMTSAANVVIAGNVIQAGSSFFGMYVGNDGTQILGNRILGNTLGYGMYVQGNSAVVTGNVVTGANLGFVIAGSNSVLTGDVATGGIIGLVLSGTGTTASRCSFLGNVTAGIAVDNAGTTATLTECNIVGNGTYAPMATCGFDGNGSAVTVKDSYWGSATGPGADPADATCDAAPGSTTPFATKPITVKLKGIR